MTNQILSHPSTSTTSAISHDSLLGAVCGKVADVVAARGCAGLSDGNLYRVSAARLVQD